MYIYIYIYNTLPTALSPRVLSAWVDGRLLFTSYSWHTLRGTLRSWFNMQYYSFAQTGGLFGAVHGFAQSISNAICNVLCIYNTYIYIYIYIYIYSRHVFVPGIRNVLYMVAPQGCAESYTAPHRSMYVYVCIYIYIYIYICIYVYGYVCVHIYIYIYVYRERYVICVYIYIYK